MGRKERKLGKHKYAKILSDPSCPSSDFHSTTVWLVMDNGFLQLRYVRYAALIACSAEY